MHIIVRGDRYERAPRIIVGLLILVLIAWGAQGGVSLLNASMIIHSTDAVTVSDKSYDLVVNFYTGPSYAHVTYRLASFAIVTVPQIAVWAEDSDGHFFRTLYVTPAVRTIDRPRPAGLGIPGH